jgi:hypothetical protein
MAIEVFTYSGIKGDPIITTLINPGQSHEWQSIRNGGIESIFIVSSELDGRKVYSSFIRDDDIDYYQPKLKVMKPGHIAATLWPGHKPYKREFTNEDRVRNQMIVRKVGQSILRPELN